MANRVLKGLPKRQLLNCYQSPETANHRIVLENRKPWSYDRNMAAMIKNGKGAGAAVVG